MILSSDSRNLASIFLVISSTSMDRIWPFYVVTSNSLSSSATSLFFIRNSGLWCR